MIKVLSWNTRKEKGPIFEALYSINDYDIICIQEPPLIPYNLLKQRYALIGSKGSKTAIYVNKRYPPNVWNYTIFSDCLI